MRTTHTSSEDWRSAAEFLGDAAAVESLHELDEFAPPRVRQLFFADLVLWERFNNSLSHLSFRVDPIPVEQVISRHGAFIRHFHEHPGHPSFLKNFGRGMVFVMSDFSSTRSFLQTGLWREAYIHIRAKHQLGISGRIGPNAIHAIGLNRLIGDFGPRDRELAKFIQPRLLSIIRSKIRRQQIDGIAGSMSDFFKQTDAAFALANPRGDITEISPAGRALFARALPNGTQTKDLLPKNWGSLRTELRSGAGAASKRRFVLVPLLGGINALVLWLSPDRSALVIFQEPSSPNTSLAARLTRREAEILAWLGEGKSNAEIGALLGISPRTVEKHCGSMFTKLGVESRVAAALLAHKQASS